MLPIYMITCLLFSNDGTESPVQQNPAVDIGALNIPMRLAINTAQYGRIFEDRSHVFQILPRPTTIQVLMIILSNRYNYQP